MPFDPTVFVNEGPPAIDANQLNKLGQGIATATSLAESLAASTPDIRVSQTQPSNPSVGTVWISF